MVLDGAAIGDVDYTAAAILTRAIEHLRKRGIRLAVSTVLGPVREQLDRYGIGAARQELLRARAELEAQAPPGAPRDPVAAKLGKGKLHPHNRRPR